MSAALGADTPPYAKSSLNFMPRVEVFSWNPRRSRLPLAVTNRLPIEIGRRINNFGDLLGPLVVSRVLAMHQIDEKAALRDRRLMSVGSVLHLARDGDVIWGAGVNGKVPDNCYHFRTLDVRSVRGPKTRDFLSRRGINAPTIFGDPVLLLPIVMPELTSYAQVKRHSLTVVPNFNDFAAYASTPELLNPRLPVDVCLRRIAQSELVVGSSLHGIVVAESMGVPARLVRSSVEDQFKYQDYYLGTGRPESKAARTIDEAVRMGGERPPIFDPAKLLAAFPLDLWGAR